MPDKARTINLARNLAKSLRPRIIFLSWVVYSCVVIVHNGIDVTSIILGLVLFIAMYGIVALQNDLSDIETDRLNHRRDIPYAMGLLTESQLMKTMLVLSIIATTTALLLNYQVLLWVGLYVTLGYIYSGPLNVKSRGVIAALLLGFCYGAMPWLIGATITGQLSEVSLICMAMSSFVFSGGIIVIKDFKDIKGDTKTHKRTLLVAKGPTYTRRYYLLVTSLSYVLLTSYLYLISRNELLAVIGTAAGLVNYWLLETRTIFSDSSSRSVRGKWARVLFFSYALSVYLMIATKV